MESGQALGPGSFSEGGRILEPVFRDPFYVVYSAESTSSGGKIGITEYFPADLVARAPSGEVLLRSLELQDLFNLGRDRFIAEANALTALRHPNLIRFDGVVSDHGTAFALHAAEEGQSTMGFVRSSKQPLPQEELDASVKQLISALELLHSRNLIHANITPDTVLLRPDPLLVRFGATRSFLAARMRKLNLAVTPGYSAPELHFSEEKAHGPLCDIFSLAAVLYFVVTGRHPINVIARGLGHTMPPAAALPSQRFRPQFLEAIDRGLELQPERRPSTMKAFGDMLLGIPEKKASESIQPALRMAANVAEGSQVRAAPAAPPLNGANSPPAKPVLPKPSASIPSVETEDEDEELEDTWELGSGWRGLGVGRLLAVGLVLLLLISAGLWMLEAQFRKQPEQLARLDPGRSAERQNAEYDRVASQDQPSHREYRDQPAGAKPSEENPVTPAPEEPNARTAIEPETSSESKEREPEVSNPLPEKATEKHPSDVPAAEPPAPSRTREAAVQRPQAKQSDATLSAPTVSFGKPASEKAPAQVAKAEPTPPPLTEASALSPAGFEFKDCDFCPPLVVLPNGDFNMGSNENAREKPVHKVRISHPFAIGQYEVTYAEWDRCVDAGACRYRPEHQGSPNEAIGNLSWDDVATYLKWISEKTGQVYRLPSEAEWEYAARGGSGKISCSACGSASRGQAVTDSSPKPNPFGLYDTAGSMAEWVQDCWNETYQRAPIDGSSWTKGDCSLRGLRGGSFGNNGRWRYDRDVRYEANGFRVLRELR